MSKAELLQIIVLKGHAAKCPKKFAAELWNAVDALLTEREGLIRELNTLDKRN
jgi:hypothetical protein